MSHMPKISLGFSTCPNDTFMFDAMVHHRINTHGFEFEVTMADILHLNRMAMAGELDMVKVSYNTYGRIQQSYELLQSGSALGFGCGPLLISKESYTREDVLSGKLKIGIPGTYTTANLLLNFYAPNVPNREEMLFHEIMPALKEGRIDAGVIIHENRFTYQQHGLRAIADLGEYWEAETKLPIPLGGIVAKKDLGEDTIRQLETILSQSVQAAFDQPENSMPFVREHAQEMDEEVIKAHIGLYVNEFSVNLGENGNTAVTRLLEEGERMSLF